MGEFKVAKIIDSSTVIVEPFWQMDYSGRTYSGNKVNIRGLEGFSNVPAVGDRLEKILLNTSQELLFSSPELIEYSDSSNAIVSCSVYLSRTNVCYYFPEFIPNSFAIYG